MEYMHDAIVKKEKEDFEEDSNDNYLETSFDVKIKVEDVGILHDWCIQNALAFQNSVLSYEELKDQSIQACIICRQLFSDSYSLLCHNLVHLRVPLIQRKLFLCDNCPKYFKRKNDLQDHITSVHETRHNKLFVSKCLYKCKECNRTYKYKNWHSHIKEVHGQLQLKCEECHMIFKCKRYLKRHVMFTHMGIKPAWRSGLKERSRNGEVIENVKCPICPKLISSKYALTTHMRNCHSDKQYTCRICKSTLKCRSYLLSHMKRVHYDDGVTHQCDICGKGFKSPRYVKIHIKNSHSKKKA